MYHDAGGGGARARSARIRASHDYEATQLESMRRRSAELASERPASTSRASLAWAALRRVTGHREPSIQAGVNASSSPSNGVPRI